MMVKHTCSSLSLTHASGPSELSDAVSSARPSSAHARDASAQAGVQVYLLVNVVMFWIDALKRIVGDDWCCRVFSRRVKSRHVRLSVQCSDAAICSAWALDE
jgi:hypothetical protein